MASKNLLVFKLTDLVLFDRYTKMSYENYERDSSAYSEYTESEYDPNGKSLPILLERVYSFDQTAIDSFV